MDIDLSFEIKANLNKEQIKLLYDSGIREVQPGIESLSTPVLKLMKKGISTPQIIQFFKWSKEIGINYYWNILWGFPKESPEQYFQMAKLVPSLTHFTPPVSSGIIRLDRFSPNFDNAEALGLKDIVPYPAYRYVYPQLNDEVLMNLAYFFSFDYQSIQEVELYTQPLQEQLKIWKDNHNTSELVSIDIDDMKLYIIDLRPISDEPVTILSGIQKSIYLRCDALHSTNRLQKLITKDTGKHYTEKDIVEIIEPLLKRRLMFKEGSSYLSLAIPVGSYIPKNRNVYKHVPELLKHLPKLLKPIDKRAIRQIKRRRQAAT